MLKSDRHKVADHLADVIVETGMTRPFGGTVQRANDSRTYDILFSMPATCDGMVRVFSPSFILIIARGSAVPGAGEWREVYTSQDDAEAWLRHIARGDRASAAAIMTRAQRAPVDRNIVTPRRMDVMERK